MYASSMAPTLHTHAMQQSQVIPFQARCEQLDGELNRALHVRPDECGVHARAAPPPGSTACRPGPQPAPRMGLLLQCPQEAFCVWTAVLTARGLHHGSTHEHLLIEIPAPSAAPNLHTRQSVASKRQQVLPALREPPACCTAEGRAGAHDCLPAAGHTLMMMSPVSHVSSVKYLRASPARCGKLRASGNICSPDQA